MKLYKSSVWLHKKYVKEKRTAKEIAAMCDVTEMTINRYLHKFGLVK